MRILLILLALALVPGCFISRRHINHPISAEAIAALVPGTSTARDVVEMLGAPTEVVQLGHRSAYRYDHTEEKQAALFLLIIGLRGVDTKTDRTWVFFDESDVLSHVGTTLEASDARYRIPGLR